MGYDWVMAGESKSWKLGKAEVRVTLPEGVTEGLSKAWTDAMAGVGADRRTARKAPARERLSVDRIVDVAIEQMREKGYDAVTMRSIAKELDTGPASLYAHVANRGELDGLVLDRVASQWKIPQPDPEHWDEQLDVALHDLLDLYRAHPGVARASMGMIPMQPGALVAAEGLLALLRAGNIPDRYAAWFIDLTNLYVGSVAVEEDIWRQRGAETDGPADEETIVAAVRDFMTKLPVDHFPLISSMADVMTSGGGDERFDFSVKVLIAGLKALSGA
jgi:AcrR family transcriptional regulator